MKKHGIWSFLSVVGVLLALPLLASCADMEKSVGRAVEDPKYLPAAYASVAGTICLLLVIFSDWSLWRSLLNTVRYVGILSLVVAPIYWMASGDISAGIAMGLSGLAGTASVTLMFRDDFKRWSEEDSDSN